MKTGSLYHVKDVHESLPKDDEWFTEHIVVRGDTITIDSTASKPSSGPSRRIGPAAAILWAAA